MLCYYVYKSDSSMFLSLHFIIGFTSRTQIRENAVANTWNGHDCEVAHWKVELVTSQNVLSSHHKGKQRRTTAAKITTASAAGSSHRLVAAIPKALPEKKNAFFSLCCCFTQNQIEYLPCHAANCEIDTANEREGDSEPSDEKIVRQRKNF